MARASVPPTAAIAQVPVRPAPARQREGRRSPSVIPTGIDAVADAARDVLEHAARLGTTISWDQVCAQVKGLAGLSGDQQRRALRSASARSCWPLTAGRPHHHR